MPLEFPKGSITLDFAKKVAPGSLAEDVEGDNTSATNCDSTGTYGNKFLSIVDGADLTMATKTLNFDANSLAFAVGCVNCNASSADALKLRLFMGGVQMQETGFIPDAVTRNDLCRDFKALSGAQTCYISIHNSFGSAVSARFYSMNTISKIPAMIGVGSVKLV